MRVAVFGNFGVRNLGDDLILEGFLKDMNDLGHEVIVFSGYPDQVRDQFGVESHLFFPGGLRSYWRSLFHTETKQQLTASVKALISVDRVVVGGGGILVDHHWKALLLWYMQLRSLMKLGKPFSFASNSIELRSWSTRRLFLPFLRTASEITVRDQASQTLLRRMGIASERVEDFALRADLPTTPVPALDRLPVIALALCTWRLNQQHFFALKSFLKNRQQEGYQFVGIAMQTVGDDDRMVYRELELEIPIVSERDEVFETLRTSSLLIGMRYHAVLLALHFQTPLIALPYQQKVRSLLEDHGRHEDLLAISDLNQKNLQSLFEKRIEPRATET